MTTDGAADVLRALRRVTACQKHADEQCEARVQGLKDLIRSLSETGGARPMMVLGDLVAAPDLPADGDQPQDFPILQIALVAPHGVGVVVWSPEARERADRHSKGLAGVAAEYFAPYEGLKPRQRRIVHAYLADLQESAEAALAGGE